MRRAPEIASVGPSIVLPLDRLPPHARRVVEAAINLDAVLNDAEHKASVQLVGHALADLAGALLGAVKK